MAGKELIFADLFPEERDTFTLEDGGSIDFLNPEDMGAEDLAAVMRAQRGFEQGINLLGSDPGNIKAIKMMETSARVFVKTILPEIPDKLMSRLNTGRMAKIMEWWTDRHAVEESGEVVEESESPADSPSPD